MAKQDYEIDTAELFRLAQVADEYAAIHHDTDLADYADGVRDVLRYLAGDGKARQEPTLLGVLEASPDAVPRLVP
jgi:hypothetical protein